MKDEKNRRRILQVVERGWKNTVQNNQKQQQRQRQTEEDDEEGEEKNVRVFRGKKAKR